MFLTAKQLNELTGYCKYKKQADWLSQNNYKFDIRSDGRPNVLLQQLVERQCANPIESKPVPNLSFLKEVS